MTLITLGKIGLHVGMTKAEAEMLDEEIKKANHGKAPVDKNGKALQTNLSLFQAYDANKDGYIDYDEYTKYQDDKQKEAENFLDKVQEDIKKLFNDLKEGKVNKINKPKNYAL